MVRDRREIKKTAPEGSFASLWYSIVVIDYALSGINVRFYQPLYLFWIMVDFLT